MEGSPEVAMSQPSESSGDSKTSHEESVNFVNFYQNALAPVKTEPIPQNFNDDSKQLGTRCANFTPQYIATHILNPVQGTSVLKKIQIMNPNSTPTTQFQIYKSVQLLPMTSGKEASKTEISNSSNVIVVKEGSNPGNGVSSSDRLRIIKVQPGGGNSVSSCGIPSPTIATTSAAGAVIAPRRNRKTNPMSGRSESFKPQSCLIESFKPQSGLIESFKTQSGLIVSPNSVLNKEKILQDSEDSQQSQYFNPSPFSPNDQPDIVPRKKKRDMTSTTETFSIGSGPSKKATPPMRNLEFLKKLLSIQKKMITGAIQLQDLLSKQASESIIDQSLLLLKLKQELEPHLGTLDVALDTIFKIAPRVEYVEIGQGDNKYFIKKESWEKACSKETLKEAAVALFECDLLIPKKEKLASTVGRHSISVINGQPLQPLNPSKLNALFSVLADSKRMSNIRRMEVDLHSNPGFLSQNEQKLVKEALAQYLNQFRQREKKLLQAGHQKEEIQQQRVNANHCNSIRVVNISQLLQK